MKTKSKIMTTLFVVGMLIFSSCKKGDTGAAGTNGTNGNANVKTQIAVVTAWIWDATNYYNSCAIAVPNLTTDINNSGAVFVYLQVTGGNWSQLPRTVAITASTSLNQRFFYNTGNVTVIFQNSDLTQPSTLSATVKIICISSSGLKQHPNLNYSNYAEVKSAYKL